MRLFIAEKPIQAQAIAAALGIEHADLFFIRCGDENVVTWAEGHLYEQADPKTYDARYEHWKLKDLPIIPAQWRWDAISGQDERLGVIHRLMQEANVIVHACDPDREGQLIGDEIIAKAPVTTATILRLWPQGLSSGEILKAIGTMRPNADYRNLMKAAIARAEGDWLWGINLTRKLSLEWRNDTGDRSAKISVGRVKTPTLKLVVDRDAEIAAFQPTNHYGVEATIRAGGGAFQARWIPPSDAVTDHGLFLDHGAATTVASTVDGKPGIIERIEDTTEHIAPDLPLNLAELQILAYRAARCTAKQTLFTAQALYDRYRIISYPRTSSRYLNDADHVDGAKTIAAIATNNKKFTATCARANPQQKSRAWNTAKAGAVSSHTAIIPLPVQANLSALTATELLVYNLVCRFYLAQFLPDCVEQQRVVHCVIAGHAFQTVERIRLQEGWRSIIPSKTGITAPLPSGLSEGAAIRCQAASVIGFTTTSPQPYNDGTLIATMRDISSVIANKELAQQLADVGIGTEATRADIIETLIERDKLLERRDANIRSTEKGQLEIEALAAYRDLTSPESTARNEQILAKIEAGEESPDTFLSLQVDLVRYHCRLIRIPSQVAAKARSLPRPQAAV